MKNTRRIIWDILNRVILEQAYASLLMRSLPQDLSRPDIGFISEIVYGTLRNKDFLELQWRNLARGKVRPKTAVLLDFSVYQLLFTDRVPSYAVISQAVDLVPPRDKGFVNAILRAVQKRGRIDPVETGLEGAAIRTSHPLFLLRMWAKQYGEDKAIAIAEQDQKPAAVYARRNPLKLSAEELAAQGIATIEGDCFRFQPDVVPAQWLSEGKIIIQGRSSQKVVPYLDAKSGMRVMDVCSAPGTKAQQIAAAMNNEGEILAYDIYPERVKLIDSLMARTGVSIVKAQVRDGTKELEAGSPLFDRILIDAPCSGLGDLSHKPEIRFHITPQSLDALSALQKKLLDVNARYLKAGGRLVYSTCTLNKKENEKQVQSFLLAHDDFRLIEEHTMFPMDEESDGFYVAVMERAG